MKRLVPALLLAIAYLGGSASPATAQPAVIYRIPPGVAPGFLTT